MKASSELQFLYDERASIKEFHGNIPRDEAEAQAAKEVSAEYKARQKKGASSEA